MYVDVPILDRCERCIFEKQVSLTDTLAPPTAFRTIEFACVAQNLSERHRRKSVNNTITSFLALNVFPRRLVERQKQRGRNCNAIAS